MDTTLGAPSNGSFCGIMAVNINGAGPNSATKIKELQVDFENNKAQVLFLAETKVSKLGLEFYQIFPPLHYDVKHTNLGQGFATITKISSAFSFTIIDVSAELTPMHMVMAFSTATAESMPILGLYQPPSRTFPSSAFQQFNLAKIIIGDLNCYLDGALESAREEQLNEWLAREDNQYININDECTWQWLTRHAGPDLALVHSDLTGLGLDCSLTSIYSDHRGLVINKTAETSTPIPQKSRSMAFNYTKVAKEEIDQAISALHRPNLNEIRNIWTNALKICRTTHTEPRHDLQLQDKLKSLADQSEIEEFMTGFCSEAETSRQTGKIFQIIQFLSDCKDGKDEAVLKVKAVPEESSEFDNFKNQISTPPTLSPTTQIQYKRCKRFWHKTIKFRHVEPITMKEYERAWQNLNKQSLGPDRVPASWLPSSEKGKSNLLFAINGLLLSTRELDRFLLQSKLQFIPKSGNKLRPLCMVSRLSALIENLIAHRVDQLLRQNKFYDNRHGFLQSRSVDTLFEELTLNVWDAKHQKQKACLINLDQRSAYNLVNHQKLCIKLTKLIKQSGNRPFYSMIIGFTWRWLGEGRRRVCFGKLTCRVFRGVPQGSPLSCTAYVCFFDFDTGRGIFLCFADDSSILVIGASWMLVDREVETILEEFNTWCVKNDQVLNLDKSKVLYFNRRVYPDNVACEIEKSAFKSLGIHIDTGFNFSKHVTKLEEWVKRRCNILRLLRNKLKFSTKSLIQVIKSWRIKLIFGSFWILNLAESNLNRLRSCFIRLTKAAFGFNKLVDPKAMLDAVGIPSLECYLDYWFSCKQFHNPSTTGIFCRADQETKKSTLAASTSRPTRASTKASTTASIIKASKFTDSTFRWLNAYKDNLPFLGQLKDPTSYKRDLKRKMFGLEICKVHDEKMIRKIVDDMNTHYYDKIMK